MDIPVATAVPTATVTYNEKDLANALAKEQATILRKKADQEMKHVQERHDENLKNERERCRMLAELEKEAIDADAGRKAQEWRARNPHLVALQAKEAKERMSREQEIKNMESERMIREKRAETESAIRLQDVNVKQFKENIMVVGAGMIGCGVAIFLYAQL